MKRFAVLFAALAILAAPLTLAGTASAQSSSDSPIQDGLNRAYGLLFGGSNSSATSSSTTFTAQSSKKPAAQSTKKMYAALGDSVAAGAGLTPKPNPVGNDTRCGRSSDAYAHRVAREIGLPKLFIPCSGATAGDLLTKQGVSGANIKAQVTRAYEAGTPQVITITAGANDANWKKFILACYTSSCNTESTSAASDASLLVLKGKLHAAIQTISVKSGINPPTVILTGYYNPVSSACAVQQTRITSAELAWIESRTTALNRTISQVASNYSWVRYAAVDFTGHDICSSEPWVQGLSDAAPLHPTTVGQQAIADAVIEHL